MGLPRIFSSTTVWKHQFFGAQPFLMVQLSHPYMITGKTIALTICFVRKVMSLLFNMLSRFVRAFLPRSKHLNFVAAVTICSDLGAQENKVHHCFHFLPIYTPWSDGTDCHDLSISSVQLLSRVWLFASPWTSARQASLSIADSQNLLKLMSIESVMPSSHLILCRPLLLLPPIPPSIRVFSSESTLRMRWPKY